MEPLRRLRHSSLASFRSLDPLMRCLTPSLIRTMATETPIPPEGLAGAAVHANTTAAIQSFVPRSRRPNVPATVFNFPSMEPLRYVDYPANYLNLPLRKDILHRAIVYEGDSTRQGTASTKWRDDVHGSGRKLYAQKGTGQARVGDKKSPIRRGGGVAFGPHPRDFSTGLQKKVYDLAWRTAFSYRYRRGELIIVEKIAIPEGTGTRLFRNILESNNWGMAHGRSMLIMNKERELTHAQLETFAEEEIALIRAMKEGKIRSAEAMKDCGDHARLLDHEEVDVKNLLQMGRIVIEERALNRLLRNHHSDL